MKYAVTLKNGNAGTEVLKIEADDCCINFSQGGTPDADGNYPELAPVAYEFTIEDGQISVAYVPFDSVLHIIGQK